MHQPQLQIQARQLLRPLLPIFTLKILQPLPPGTHRLHHSGTEGALIIIILPTLVAVVTLPMSQQTILLAMDVSGSMRATDVQPSRIVAAQNAAKAFLTELPREVRVGIVAFAGSAQVAQIPTLNREDLVSAIDRFQLQRGTAIGNGIRNHGNLCIC